MEAETMLSVATFMICGIIFVAIGCIQLKQKMPTAFYTGEAPPKDYELTDVIRWNKNHGYMWIVYGILFAANPLILGIFGNPAIRVSLLIAAVIIETAGLIFWHYRLTNIYRRRY